MHHAERLLDMEAEEGMKLHIETLILEKLKRPLTEMERKRILKLRALMGYESIIDYISDESLTRDEVEEYIRKVD